MSDTTPTTPTPPPSPPPEKIGPYRIERELGAGGMGTVYLGHHVESGKTAAVKVLPAALAREPGFVARFLREVEAMQKLKSPHIVELYESGVENEIPYYAMEFIDGETLADRVIREKRLPWRDVIDIGVQVARALKAAHNTGIIHRDLKPSNLMINREGTVKLTDFGIAQVFATSKLTMTGGILGTPEYMSPEQSQGRRATKQSDIYSLGAVMYVMLTGRPPFTGKSALDIAQKHRFSQFDSPRRIVPEIPHWLDEIVCQCLAKKPEDRYPDPYVLMLRLQEVPQKVALREGGQPAGEMTSPDAETLAGTVPGEPHRDDIVGGTLVKELFQAQLEEQKRGSPVAQWLNNIWVLLGLLVLIIAFVAAMAVWNRQDPEELFARGQELMSRPEGPSWVAARRDYFNKLLRIDRPTWEPKVAPYLEDIDYFERKRAILNKDQPASEPEAQFRRILELHDSGLTGAAREQLAALVHLLVDNDKHQELHDVAQHTLEKMAPPADSTRFDFLNDSLANADRLEKEGNSGEARRIWRSVLELYDAEPDAAEYVQKARQRLHQLNAETLENSQPGTD
ncbi:MAG: serine/threonine protein kinase [Planctomycetaceae bacterium]|nr:serine/threonine protein kinase [Planctomycetaceae bacterium]